MARMLTLLIPAGGTYLRRLFMLILDRMEALKRMLLVAPGPLHLPTVLCGPSERSRDVSGPWALAVSQLMVDARADVPGARLEATLNSLLLQCACPECRTAIQHRIRAIVLEWQAVRVSSVKLPPAFRARRLIRWLAQPKAHYIAHFPKFGNITHFLKTFLISYMARNDKVRGGKRQAPPFRRTPMRRQIPLLCTSCQHDSQHHNLWTCKQQLQTCF